MSVEPIVAPDPQILYALACVVGGVDLGSRLPKRGGVTLEDVPAEEAADLADRLGMTFEPDGCLPDEATSSDTTVSNSVTVGGDVKVTTTRTQKTVNADGTVTTTTTTTKPDGTQSVQVDTEPFTVPKPAGVLLRINTELGVEFTRLRPLTKLRVGDSISVLENYTDRTVLRAWSNAVVHAPPKWTFLAHAGGAEFHNISLEFLIIGGRP